MKKIKVLYIVSSLRFSGPTNQLLGIVNNIDRSQFEPIILTLSPEPFDSRKVDFELIDGLRIESLGLTKSKMLLQGKNRINNFIRTLNPDIIHTSGIRADSIVSKGMYRFRQVCTIRSFAPEDFSSKFGKTLGRIMSFKTKKNIESAANVIYCSNSLKSLYDKYLGDYGFVIQNGVDVERFQPVTSESSRIKIKRKLEIPEDKKIFISIGSLIDLKNPLLIIDSFIKANKNNEAVLIILGDGPLKEECLVNSDSSIYIKGNVINVDEYLKVSDYFISASRTEGMPNTVLEAGSTGVNLILSNIPQHNEILEGFPIEDVFFSLKTNDELTELIRSKISKMESMFNNELSKFILSQYSMKSMSIKYQNIYRELNRTISNEK